MLEIRLKVRMQESFSSTLEGAIPVLVLKKDGVQEYFSKQKKQPLECGGGTLGKLYYAPTSDNKVDHIIYEVDDLDPIWTFSALRKVLPEGDYSLLNENINFEEACLGWALEGYVFNRYKSSPSEEKAIRLVWPKSVDQERVVAFVKAITLVRDLINLPANDLGPTGLEEAARGIAQAVSAKIDVTDGKILQEEFPAVYAVGKASADQPRLIHLTWYPPNSQARLKLCLVGKGVCFDSGGLDIKSSSNMLLMKKDMGGAAHVLGIGYLIMALDLPVDLHVIIPAVENSVSGNAMRPLDVIPSRKGLTIEIGNTDAEGRVILADALQLAAEQKPDQIIDFATLTGAARVALGLELPALFSNDEKMAKRILEASDKTGDSLWRLPLHKPYKSDVKGKVADLTNSGSSSWAGAITAALFLEHFVPSDVPWAHIDLMAWNVSSKPGRPEGGEAMGLRAIFSYIESLI